MEIRPDWDKIKLSVMRAILEAKFRRPDLMNRLIHTFPKEIVEDNNWHDTYWGVCEGVGENHLGELLMEVREKCFQEKPDDIRRDLGL
jgi:predicted NAD-dependent protein-ADP-ribosyltransferase YbiA (DUF1768 family)